MLLLTRLKVFVFMKFKSIYRRLLQRLYFDLMVAHNAKIYREFRDKYDISDEFKFNGDFINFYGNGKIEILENSYIGNYSTIAAVNDCFVLIGRNCRISHNVRMYTSTIFSDQNFDTDDKIKTLEGDIVIGNGSWIGANVFINPGVIIGNNCVVGANSVLPRNMHIPDGSIVGGVPAKIIKMKTGC